MTHSRLTLLALSTLTLVACSDPESGLSREDVVFSFGEPTDTKVVEAVSYTDQAYTFTGEDSIQSVVDLIPSGPNVYYGVDEDVEIPFEADSGQCDRFNGIDELSELPKTIEGVVTLHPRYFQKTSFCGNDERYYASFLLEDSSGGILVLKDSRVADFTYGDRVRLRVRGVLKFFDTRAVLIHDREEVVSTGNDVFYNDVGFKQLEDSDIGKNYRIRGVIADPPTNSNFSEMCLVPEGESFDACSFECRNDDDCSGYMLVTLDREIVQRDGDAFRTGRSVEVTGPVVNSFGFRLLVARIGQLQFD